MSFWDDPSQYMKLIHSSYVALDVGDEKAFGEITSQMALLQIQSDERHSYAGFRLSHIDSAMRPYVVGQMLPGLKYITKEEFYFHTLGDIPGREYKINRVGGSIVPEGISFNLSEAFQMMRQGYFNHDGIDFLNAVKQKMLIEAQGGEMPVVGSFILLRTPIDSIDSYVGYDRLRVTIKDQGMMITIQYHNQFIPVWWSPYENTIEGIHSAHFTLALDVYLACLWRDAHVVEYRELFEKQQDHKPSRKDAKKIEKFVRLPRIMRVVHWGLEPERERIIKTAHTVRGHYRKLGEDRTASQAATDNAEMYGFPEPPDGFTFVQPHTRGKGDAHVTVPRLICKGLAYAKIALEQS